MANVDKCVREAENGLCGNIEIHANNIFKLPTSNKVILFKNKNIPYIINCLSSYQEYIKETIINIFYKNINIDMKDIELKPSSDDNKDGADVFHILPNGKRIDIEVKFGSKTDKQIGQDSFMDIFGTDVFKKALSVSQRKEWVRLYKIDRNDENQKKRLEDVLNAAVNEFNSKNIKVSKELNNLIIDNSGDTSKTGDYYLQFNEVNGKFKLIHDHNFLKSANWTVDKIRKIDSNTKRVNIFIRDINTQTKIKFVLNWKNNYKIKDIGISVAARISKLECLD